MDIYQTLEQAFKVWLSKIMWSICAAVILSLFVSDNMIWYCKMQRNRISKETIF